jgi:cyclic beta-1,2-glucan synthetase
VISGAVPRARAEAGMRSVEQHLVSEPDRLVRLLAPPFEHTPHDPGYIKGYVPGVRENGGQYTHAALWVVRAMAELGWRDRAAATLAMLSPVSHARTPAEVARYQVEPYVIAADVYGAPPHVGRGGWTWYTGSAGWMQRVAIESVLGMRVENGSHLRLAPCIPDTWPEARIEWRVPGSETLVRIRYANPLGRTATVTSATLDGAPVAIEDGAAVLALPHDGGTHEVVVTLG